MERLKTARLIDRVLNHIVENRKIICDAHNQLGVSVEDLICSAVKKALSSKQEVKGNGNE